MFFVKQKINCFYSAEAEVATLLAAGTYHKSRSGRKNGVS